MTEPGGNTYTAEQILLYRNTLAPHEATLDEVKAAVEMAKRTGLDLFSGFINLLPKYDRDLGRKIHKPTLSIDGFRALAERSEKYEGQTPPQWCGDDEVWKEVWISEKPPAAARVGVRRRDFREPMYAVAVYRSYVQTYTKNDRQHISPMWVKMPAEQLAKCAEMLALRKAFPDRLAKIYGPEELGQANNEVPDVPVLPEGIDEADVAEAVAANTSAPTTPAPRMEPPPPLASFLLQPATQQQLGSIRRHIERSAIDPEELMPKVRGVLDERIKLPDGQERPVFGWDGARLIPTGLDKREASALIDLLKALPTA